MTEHLAKAIEAFAASVAKFEKKFGTIELGSTTAIDPPFALGGALEQFYSTMLLRDKPELGGKMHIKLFPLEQLPAAQEGWRWITGRDGQRAEDPNWPAGWVVFADRNGDAIVIDAASPDGILHGSIQKRSFPMAPNLAAFLRALASAMDQERTEFDYEVMDEDFVVLDSFRAAIESIALRELGADFARGFMKFFFE